MMSLRSRYTDSNGRPAQSPVENRESCVSGGVDIRIKGWTPGLEKVRLTKTLRAGGVGLREAAKMTGDVLKGEEVRVHLDQFETIEEARTALRGIGVETVRPPTPSR